VYRSCGELQDGERVVYYSVFFDNDVYKGTRQSLIMEACEAQQFTPVDQSPPPATTDVPTKAQSWLAPLAFCLPGLRQAWRRPAAGFQLGPAAGAIAEGLRNAA